LWIEDAAKSKELGARLHKRGKNAMDKDPSSNSGQVHADYQDSKDYRRGTVLFIFEK
jgi:hypothetical protein